MKLLISITSYNERERPFLEKVLANYQSEFADAKLQFVLSVNYPFDIPPNAMVLPKQYDGWRYTWNNKEYVAKHYHSFDFIIDSDADCHISRINFDHYVTEASKLSLDYVPGFMSYEEDKQGGKHLITLQNWETRVSEKWKLNGKHYITPYNLHTPAVIVDKHRYHLAIKDGLKMTPYRWHFYTEAEMSRTALYYHFKKVVAVDGIQSGNALVWHTPNKYHNNPFCHCLSVERFLSELNMYR